MSKKVTKKQPSKVDSSKKPSNSYYIVLISTFVIALCVVGGYVAVKSIIFKQEVLTQKATANKTLKANIAAATTLADEIANLERVNKIESDRALSVLPNTLDFTHISSMINNAASRSGVAIESISLFESEEVEKAPKSIDPEVTTVMLSVDAKTDYDGAREFFKTLESAKQTFNVHDFEIRGTRESVTILFNVETYYSPTIDTSISTKEVSQ